MGEVCRDSCRSWKSRPREKTRSKHWSSERGEKSAVTKCPSAGRSSPRTGSAGYYFAIIEFDSYEEPMKNSNDPAISEFAKQLGALLEGPPKFYNLDVLQVVDR